MRQILFSVLSFAFFTTTISHAKIDRFARMEPTLYRGAQLEHEGDYRYLKSLGVRTIVNVQTTDSKIEKERELAKKYGIRFLSVPIPSILFAPKERDVNRILAAMNDPSLRPLFFHCTHGRDRTGMLAALYRVHTNGWTAEQAYDEWLVMDFNDNLFTSTLSNYFWDHVE